MKKAMFFIDGSNVFFDWNATDSDKKMDLSKYIEVVKSKFSETEFVRTYYFTSETSNNKAFLYEINRLPYCEVITGRLQNKKIKLDKHLVSCPSCSEGVTGEIVVQVDKGTDVNIAVEMLRHGFNHTFDTAVLASRDADFSSVVKILKSIGCNVELVTFEASKGRAEELMNCVDNVVVLDLEDQKKCEMSNF